MLRIRLITLMFIFFAHVVWAEPEKILRIGIGQEPDSLSPNAAAMLASLYVYNMVNRNLVSLDYNLQWQGQLVEKIPTLENSLASIKKINGQNKIVSKWILRKNAQWGDGTSITCQDVKFSWMLGKTLTTLVVNRDAYSDIQDISCDTKNPKIFEMIHNQVKWDFYKMIFFYIYPKHLEQTIFEKFGTEKEGFDRNTHYVKDVTNPGLYNGPYLITELKMGSHIILKKNPKFFGKNAYFDKIVLRFISDSNALESNLLTGQIDMISSIGLSMDQALLLEKKIATQKLDARVDYVTGFAYEHIEMNQNVPALKSLEVRRALALAIDKEAMVKSLFEGKQFVAAHFLSPRDPWYKELPKELLKPLPSDKKKADSLLDESGWKKEKDGFRYKDGKKFSLTFSTTAGNKSRESVQVFIADQLKKIGIEVIIKNYPPRVFFSDFIKVRKYNGLAMFAWSLMPELTPIQYYSSSFIPTESNGWSGRNYSGYSNPKMDEFLKNLDLEMNIEKRQNLINQVVNLYVKDQITIPLYNRLDISVIPKKLKNYHQTGTQQVETLFVEDWSL